MIGSLKQRVAPALLSRLSPRAWARIVREPLAVPYYHVVSAGEVAHVKHLYRYRTAEEFRSDVDFFLRHFSIVGLAEVVQYLNGERELSRPSLLLTFDDGFREIYDVVAPILLEKGVRATFFLTTAFIDNRDLAHHNKLSLLVEHLLNGAATDAARRDVDACLSSHGVQGDGLKARICSIDARATHVVDELAERSGYDFGEYLKTQKPHLTSDQVRELLRSGFDIGAHSVDHPLYADLTLDEQLFQTRESLRSIEERFSPGCRSFAFPHSDVGVPLEFFHEMFSSGHVDVTFGTARMTRHFFPRNIERFTMEHTRLPAHHILAREYGRCAYRAVTGRRTANVVRCGV